MVRRGGWALALVLSACAGAPGLDATKHVSAELDADGDGFPQGLDCDDQDPEVYPEAEERCDGIDDNCDGQTDDEAAVDAPTWWPDADGDGYGDAAYPTTACAAPPGHVADTGDCDVADSAIHPGADERCDGLDDDCDGEIDEEAIDAPAWYPDLDGDGFGDLAAPTPSCAAPSGLISDDSDCDDVDPNTFPGATERCDAVDQDCDGLANQGLDVPTDAASIRAAIYRATEGQLICVESGVWAEHLELRGVDLRLESFDGPETTFIDGEGSGPVLTIDHGETAATEISGFTITGGDSSKGSGIFIRQASPTLHDLVVRDNLCTRSFCQGVGIYIEDAAPELSDLEVSNNIASAGSSIYGVGIYATGSTVVMEAVEVLGNQYQGSSSGGEQARGVGVAVLFTQLEWSGGAVATQSCHAPTLPSEIDGDCIGGGIFGYWSDLSLSHLRIADNQLTVPFQAAGAGLYLEDSSLSMAASIVSGNRIGNGASSAEGGGLYLETSEPVVLEGCDIVGNIVESGGSSLGGGIAASNQLVDLQLFDVHMVGNEAARGGAVGLNGADTGEGVSIAWSNSTDNGDQPWWGLSDPKGTDGNISEDPLFVDTSSSASTDWDLHLSTGSPSIDAGDPSKVDVDGTVADIGAYGGEDGDW